MIINVPVSYELNGTVKIEIHILLKQMDVRLRNGPGSRRVFGKDITNLERRSKGHSICEKASLVPELRHKSRSFDKRAPQEQKDPIQEY